MNQDQFDTCIIMACKATKLQRVVVFGSQSILAHLPDRELPAAATESREVDMSTEFHAQQVAIQAQDDALSTIDFRFGEDSPWALSNDYYIEAVDIRVSVLPEGWDHRLVTYHASNELGEATALCVSVEDTCAAKLMRLADKDKNYVAALVEAGVVSVDSIIQRLRGDFDTSEDYDRKRLLPIARQRALGFMELLDTPPVPSASQPPGLFPHDIRTQLSHVTRAGRHSPDPSPEQHPSNLDIDPDTGPAPT